MFTIFNLINVKLLHRGFLVCVPPGITWKRSNPWGNYDVPVIPGKGWFMNQRIIGCIFSYIAIKVMWVNDLIFSKAYSDDKSINAINKVVKLNLVEFDVCILFALLGVMYFLLRKLYNTQENALLVFLVVNVFLLIVYYVFILPVIMDYSFTIQFFIRDINIYIDNQQAARLLLVLFFIILNFFLILQLYVLPFFNNYRIVRIFLYILHVLLWKTIYFIYNSIISLLDDSVPFNRTANRFINLIYDNKYFKIYQNRYSEEAINDSIYDAYLNLLVDLPDHYNVGVYMDLFNNFHNSVYKVVVVGDFNQANHFYSVYANQIMESSTRIANETGDGKALFYALFIYLFLIFVRSNGVAFPPNGYPPFGGDDGGLNSVSTGERITLNGVFFADILMRRALKKFLDIWWP